MPAAASRTGWDARVLPALPVWVTRVDATLPEPSGKPAPRVWPSALEAASRIATRADEHEVLGRSAAWLRDNPVPIPLPVEERSVERFEDEKAIDAYLKTRLFTSGALTLSLLACYIPQVPFVSQQVPGTGTCLLLVVENLATYTSCLGVLREVDPCADSSSTALSTGGGLTKATATLMSTTRLLVAGCPTHFSVK